MPTTGRAVLAPSGLALDNGTIAASVSGNALTVAIKTLAGADPSPSDPVTVTFRTSAGGYLKRSITAAASAVIASTSTMGVTCGVPFRLWLVGFDNGTTIVPALINCSDTTNIYPLTEWLAASAVSGSGNSAATFYAGSAVSNVFRVLGFLTWNSGLATAGTWNVGPDITQIFGPGIPLPGTVIQSVAGQTTSQTTNATATFAATGASATIGLTSAANGVAIQFSGGMGQGVSSKIGYAQVFRGGTALSNAAVVFSGAGSIVTGVADAFMDIPGTTSALTYAVNIKTDASGSASFPAGGSTGKISLAEIMR